MDRTIKGWVDSGERMLVIVAGEQGELQYQGNRQVVEDVTEDQINDYRILYNIYNI